MRPIGAGPDVGAYERGADLSGHWALALTFKGSAAMGGIPDAGGPGAGGSSGGGGSGAGLSGGCKCSVPGEPGGGAAGGVAALALLCVRRRRPRR